PERERGGELVAADQPVLEGEEPRQEVAGRVVSWHRLGSRRRAPSVGAWPPVWRMDRARPMPIRNGLMTGTPRRRRPALYPERGGSTLSAVGWPPMYPPWGGWFAFMNVGHPTAVVQCHLDELAGDPPPEPIVRALMD